MKPTIALLVVALVVPAAFAVDAPASITNARIEVRSGATPAKAAEDVGRGTTAEWLGWSVQAIPDARSACCFSGNFKHTGCSLASRDNSWGTSDNLAHGEAAEMYVLVERKGGSPTRVRVVSPSCPVDGADRRLVWLGPVEAKASLDALSRMLDSKSSGSDVDEPALAAIAYHQDAAADARLLKRVAVENHDSDVRSQALFWLAKTKAEGAGEWIVGRLDAEQDDHVREQAVFALSQLDDGTDWLLKMLRSKRDAETIRRALFWLGQSNDPRALAELTKILEK